MPHSQKNIFSLVTASLSGLAGGVSIGSFFGPAGILIGSLLGATITGLSEYNREIKKNTTSSHSSNSINYSQKA